MEWKEGSKEALRLKEFLEKEMGTKIREDSGIGIKPISRFGTKRLVRRAIQYALSHGRRSVTLVHKGNIMKFTEGAFRDWGYEVAKEEFRDQTLLESQLGKGRKEDTSSENCNKRSDRGCHVQQVLLRPEDYDVLAMPNLNGDYLSDALAARWEGWDGARGNIGDQAAVFEATHGTAPKYANQDRINPGSLILSGVMMFDYLGWGEAGEAIEMLSKRPSHRNRDLRPGPPDAGSKKSQMLRIRLRYY